MDELQLRLPTYKVGLIADAIERDISTRGPDATDPELPRLLTWLRFRIARRTAVTTAATGR